MADKKDSTFFSPLPLFWRLLGALLLGALLARWSWILFAPHTAATPVTSEREIALEAARLFGIAASAAIPAEMSALPNVRLAGVFASGMGKTSFAVLSLNGKQFGVAAGEEVAPGIKLIEVHAGYVLLERAGVWHRVNLEAEVTGSSGTTTTPVTKDILPVKIR